MQRLGVAGNGACCWQVVDGQRAAAVPASRAGVRAAAGHVSGAPNELRAARPEQRHVPAQLARRLCPPASGHLARLVSGPCPLEGLGVGFLLNNRATYLLNSLADYVLLRPVILRAW